MDFSLTPEQSALSDSLERFVARDYDWDRRLIAIRSPQGSAPQHWATFAELGWLGAGLSEDAGGFGGGGVENALIMEAFGRALVVEPMIAHIMAVTILSRSGTPQSAVLLAEAIAGEKRIAVAHAESGVKGFATGAASKNGALVLTGDKLAVDGATVCDLLIVSALDEAGRTGLYLVDPRGEGTTVKPYRTIDNRRVADLRLDEAPVVGGAGLTGSSDAAEILEHAQDWSVVALCAEAIGAMETALYLTRDYLQTRKQFGVPLGGFQALQHAMADLLIETEMSRSMLFHALGALEDADADTRRGAVSAAKVLIGKAGVAVAAKTVQLHGGIGVTEEHRISHYYRRLFAIARLLGTEREHLDRYIATADRQA